MIRNAIHILSSFCVYFVLTSSALWADDSVVWKNMVGVSASSGSLTKTASTNSYDAGAVSSQVLRDGYGYVEFTITALSKEGICGLSNGDTNQNYTDLDFVVMFD